MASFFGVNCNLHRMGWVQKGETNCRDLSVKSHGLKVTKFCMIIEPDKGRFSVEGSGVVEGIHTPECSSSL